jgi:hypothetical protein
MEHSKKPARHVLLMSLLLTLTLNISCKSTDGTDASTTGEIDTTGELTPPVVPEPPVTITPEFPRTGNYLEQITTIAGSSNCASYSWSGRSKAPAAYIKGMALTYARSYCRLKTTEAAPTNLITVLSGAAGNSSTDALAWYSTNFAGLSMDVTAVRSETLRSLYTLGVGLGMRESSGKYCEGRDMSASNTSASTAEAGMFQTSYDSMGASSELSKLYAEYQADTSKCFLDVFKQGVSCSSTTVAGSGAGAVYQAFNKSCPSFAAEYAMLMLRVRRNHYGPINRKEAEVVPACNQMLKSVESFINNDVYACDEIL